MKCAVQYSLNFRRKIFLWKWGKGINDWFMDKKCIQNYIQKEIYILNIDIMESFLIKFKNGKFRNNKYYI